MLTVYVCVRNFFVEKEAGNFFPGLPVFYEMARIACLLKKMLVQFKLGGNSLLTQNSHLYNFCN